MNTHDFLEAIRAYQESGKKSESSERNYRIGTIDPNFTIGRPRVLFDGDIRMGDKTYTWRTGYTPVGGDRVILIPVGTTYIIQGKIDTEVRPPVIVENLDYYNGFRAYDGIYNPLRITRTAGGLVKLQGMVAAPNASGVILTYLPTSFRPRSPIRFPILYSASSIGSGLIMGEVSIDPDGIVTLWVGSLNIEWASIDAVVYNNSDSIGWKDLSVPSNMGQDSLIGGRFPEYAKDSLGRVWFGGHVQPTVNNTDASTLFTMPTGFRPQFAQWFASGTLQHEITANGVYQRKAVSNGAPRYTSYLGSTYYFDKSVTGWENLTYWNNWKSFSPTIHAPLSYLKDADGVVHLRGFINGGTGTTAIATLPAGFRPKYRILSTQPMGASTMSTARIDISADGVISAQSGYTSWISLDGMCFVAEQ